MAEERSGRDLAGSDGGERGGDYRSQRAGQIEHARAPRLLDQLSAALRLRHASPRTEDSYRKWVRRFILFHDKRHPRELGPEAITAFLNHLAVEGRVAAATQNQALNAIVFLYKRVLDRDVPELDHLPDALARKYPNAPRVWIWQWVFPATSRFVDPATGRERRHHFHETAVQRPVRAAGPGGGHSEAGELSFAAA